MLILIEGADGSGKTTLYQQLSDKYFLIPKEFRNKCLEHVGDFLRLLSDDKPYVMDRSPITDIVYRLDDNMPRRGISLIQFMEVLDRNQVIIVLCDTDTCYDDSMKRGETNVVTKERSNNIRNLYKLITNMFETFADVPVYRYDWHNDTVDNVIDFIERSNKHGV